MSKGLEQSVEYLKKYKDTYSLESLKIQLQNSGYPQGIIEDAVSEVFFGKKREDSVSMGFFDFKNKKVYTSFGSKLADFLFGFIGGIIIIWVAQWLITEVLRDVFGYNAVYRMGMVFSLAFFAASVYGTFYFWRRRHYLARGLLLTVLLGFLFGFLGLGFSYIVRGLDLWF